MWTAAYYARAVTYEFRWTWISLAALVAIGASLYANTPDPAFGNRPPPLMTAVLAAWMALFAQGVLTTPSVWYLALLVALYPLLGFVLIGEGVIRFGLMMLSRRRGEIWWMKVMASTHRDHVIVCGLGHVGYRVFEELLQNRTPVVAIEKDPTCRFLSLARDSGAPILVRNMQDDHALIEAGVERARAIVVATNDDMANIEVALDSRRLNPKIRVILRLFDQQIAAKVRDAFQLDFAFSSAALSAPMVAALALDQGVVAAFAIAGVEHVALELALEPGCALDGRDVATLERERRVRVVDKRSGGAAEPAPPDLHDVLRAGDKIVVHARASAASELVAASRRAAH